MGITNLAIQAARKIDCDGRMAAWLPPGQSNI